jgi:Putative Ig domain
MGNKRSDLQRTGDNMKRALVLASFILVLECGIASLGFGQDSSAHGLPPATVDIAYGAQLQINVSGLAPFTYGFGSGAHPDWLKLSPTDGSLSGMPTANSAGNYSFSVTVSDAGGHQTTANLTLAVLAKDKTPVVSIAAATNPIPTCKGVTILEGLKPGSTTLKGTATPSQGSKVPL